MQSVRLVPWPPLLGREPTIITLYLLSRGSTSVSRKSIPSVIYLIRVRSLLLRSSKRIVYPTYFPKKHVKDTIQPKVDRMCAPRRQAQSLLPRQHDWPQTSLRRVEAACTQSHCQLLPSLLRTDTVGALHRPMVCVRSTGDRDRSFKVHVLTSRLAAPCLPDDDSHAVLLDTI